MVAITNNAKRDWAAAETVRLAPLIRSIVKKSRVPLPHEDLFQEASLGVYAALLRYDVTKGASATTWADRAARSAIQNYVRKIVGRGGKRLHTESIVSLEAFVAATKHQERHLPNPLAIEVKSPPPRDQWRKILRGFSDRERLIVLEHYVAGQSDEAIGRSIGLHQTMVSSIRRGVLARLKELDAQDGRVREACA